MVVPYGSGDLYHKYRPRKFGEISGHKEVIKSIRKAVTATSPSRAFLLIGETGTGKTTTARIMALALNCESPGKGGEPCSACDSCKAILSGSCSDLIEVNAADHRGIGDIRQLCQTMPYMPIQVKNKIYILDEAHQLTNDAQSSLLKELEEAPGHVFIILCSTHPKKILPTVKNRCQRFKFGSLRRKEMVMLLEEITTFEGEDFSPQVYNAIADAAGGSPRNAIVLLQQTIQLGSKDLSAILRLLGSEDQGDPNTFAICLGLNKGEQWGKLVQHYNDAKHVGPSGMGMMIAGYFRNQLLKSANKDRADLCASVLELFSNPFPEGKLGENHFVLNLYKAYALCKGNNAPRKY